MKVLVHNEKYQDTMLFYWDEDNEEKSRKFVLDTIHLKGWKDEDCWSEVKE